MSKAYTPYNRNEKWTSGGGKRNNNWQSGSASTSAHQSAGDTAKSEEKDTDVVAGIIQEFEGALSQYGKCLLLAVWLAVWLWMCACAAPSCLPCGLIA